MIFQKKEFHFFRMHGHAGSRRTRPQGIDSHDPVWPPGEGEEGEKDYLFLPRVCVYYIGPSVIPAREASYYSSLQTPAGPGHQQRFFEEIILCENKHCKSVRQPCDTCLSSHGRVKSTGQQYTGFFRFFLGWRWCVEGKKIYGWLFFWKKKKKLCVLLVYKAKAENILIFFFCLGENFLI